jgi:predicted lipoprotein
MKFLFSILVLSVVFACSKKSNTSDGSDFSKTELLTNLANNLILVDYQLLVNEVEKMENKFLLCKESPSPSAFDSLRSSWENTYIQWNRVAMYNFGPAMDIGLFASTATSPSDTNKINENITAGVYNLNAATNIQAIGLPALDYLFFQKNAYANFVSNQKQVSYIGDIISKLKTEFQTVNSGWKNSYTSTFIKSTGTESTSAFSMFLNEFLKNYELVKWVKVGIPLGKQTLDIQKPEYIEGRNAKLTFRLLKSNLQALKDIYEGGSSIGLDDYLIALNKKSLAESISSSFQSMILDVESYSTDFESMLTSDTDKLNALYTKIQNLVVSLKSDMIPSFGVLITYSDNDGD